MSAEPLLATVPITVRLSVEMVSKLDALASATERTRTYWVQQALEEIIERELWQIREVEEAIAADDADPEEGLSGEEFERWMVDNGLTTREALAQAAARSRK